MDIDGTDAEGRPQATSARGRITELAWVVEQTHRARHKVPG